MNVLTANQLARHLETVRRGGMHGEETADLLLRWMKEGRVSKTDRATVVRAVFELDIEVEHLTNGRFVAYVHSSSVGRKIPKLRATHQKNTEGEATAAATLWVEDLGDYYSLLNPPPTKMVCDELNPQAEVVHTIGKIGTTEVLR